MKTKRVLEICNWVDGLSEAEIKKLFSEGLTAPAKRKGRPCKPHQVTDNVKQNKAKGI